MTILIDAYKFNEFAFKNIEKISSKQKIRYVNLPIRKCNIFAMSKRSHGLDFYVICKDEIRFSPGVINEEILRKSRNEMQLLLCSRENFYNFNISFLISQTKSL